ncbi:PBS lyase HEAT-like repeat protein [Necator americanus]|uniref:Deoxyhypusine hydroxylase n=1 Tax=Necator americanus TaxID=51031 RepID=W2TUE2_NECAM|nr:PBS lyase HEAT-like repeat protein [Necator americanus]ETN84672.1 PBS lyase HEAT-like repeat protein [Necator americanus]
MERGLTAQQIDGFGAVLNDASKPLKARFRALFILRNIGCDLSIKWIAKCFGDDSALLKHELAYCLGQTQNTTAIPVLAEVLRDTSQDMYAVSETIVRHEAGEALGAIGDKSALSTLEKYSKDSCQEIAETCQLAVERIHWVNASGDKTESPYQSTDPTATALSDNVTELGVILIDPTQPLWDRLCCEDSALLRHEVAYVLGQVQSSVAIKGLKSRLSLISENCMVRHECAEALGAIATEECISILQEYAKDEERIVRESCEVALDMAEYENSSELQYADISA